MNNTLIEYDGTGYPVPLGSGVVVMVCDHTGENLVYSGRLVAYESIKLKDFTDEYEPLFCWKLFIDDRYVDVICNQISSYAIIKSPVELPSKSNFNELEVCKDLIFRLYNTGQVGMKNVGVNLLRRKHNLRNSEICELLGITDEDVNFIINNKDV